MDWAEEGHFGLYFKPSKVLCKKRTYLLITRAIKNLINKSNGREKEHAICMMKKFIYFCRNYQYLLTPKSGFERLATAMEVEIFSSCLNCSVSFFKDNNRIDGQEWNNNFGMVFSNLENYKTRVYFSPSYYFYGKSITKKDLFVFVNEIEEFNKKLNNVAIINNLSILSKEKNNINILEKKKHYCYKNESMYYMS